MASEKMDSSARPSFMHGTNEGRVDVPCRGPGEMKQTGGDKGKAQVVTQNLLKLANSGESSEGGYR